MTKQQWAKIMVGAVGTCREYTAFRIVSWVDPDKSEYPDVASCIIIFIIETDIGLPGYITKKFLKKYNFMAKEDLRNVFRERHCDVDQMFIDSEKEKKDIQQQIYHNHKIGEENETTTNNR